MASIFPSFKEQELLDKQLETLPTATDIAIDFTTGEPILVDNDFVIVTENEAVKVFCYYALKTAKGRFLMYDDKYGQTFDELVGKASPDDLVMKQKIKDCLLQNRYIKSIDNVECSFGGSTLSVDIELTTVYGTEELSMSI